MKKRRVFYRKYCDIRVRDTTVSFHSVLMTSCTNGRRSYNGCLGRYGLVVLAGKGGETRKV